MQSETEDFVDREQIHHLFHSIAIHNKERITASELKEHLKKCHLPHDCQTLQVIMRAHSSSQNKHEDYITEEEFTNYVLERIPQVQEFFGKLDANKDGVITYDELQDELKRSHNIEIEEIHVLASYVFTLLDKNKDDKISRREFFEHFALTDKYVDITKTFDCFTNEVYGESGSMLEVKDVSTTTPVWITLTAATCCGLVSRTATAPVDRLKLLRQTTTKNSTTLWQTFTKMYHSDGVKGFFKGNGTNCMKVVPERCFTFLTYDRIRQFVCEDPSHPQFYERLISGGLAGMTSQTLIYPLEVVKTRLAVTRTGTYNGTIDALRKIYLTEGGTALFKGIVPSLLGITPYAAIDLALFNTFKEHYINNHDNTPSAITLLNFGMASGIVAQTTAYPLALVRTRLQTQGAPGAKLGTKIRYDGMVDCFKTTFKYEGFCGLYKGLVPNYMKAIPAGGLSFVVFEKVKIFLLENCNN